MRGVAHSNFNVTRKEKTLWNPIPVTFSNLLKNSLPHRQSVYRKHQSPRGNAATQLVPHHLSAVPPTLYGTVLKHLAHYTFHVLLPTSKKHPTITPVHCPASTHRRREIKTACCTERLSIGWTRMMSWIYYLCLVASWTLL